MYPFEDNSLEPDVPFNSPNYWNKWSRINSKLFMRGFAIVNEYISLEDAIMIEFSFN